MTEHRGESGVRLVLALPQESSAISIWERLMAERKTHRKIAKRVAGKSGRTEVSISRKTRLDATTRTKAIEIETSGRSGRLESAARRLKASRMSSKVLVVPHRDLSKARSAMRVVKASGTVRNLSGTKRSKVSVKPSTAKAARKPARAASQKRRAARKR